MQVKNLFVYGNFSNGSGKLKFQQFDDKRVEDARNIDSITVDETMADVNFFTTSSKNIEVHFYGSAKLDGTIDFDVKVINRDLKVTLKSNGNCCDGKFHLDVYIPSSLKAISVKTTFGDISVPQGVSAVEAKFETMSGDINSDVVFDTITVKTMSGDVDICAKANSDIELNIDTMSGDVAISLFNIKSMNSIIRTMSGDVFNNHQETTGYNAKLNIDTMSGDIKIR